MNKIVLVVVLFLVSFLGAFAQIKEIDLVEIISSSELILKGEVVQKSGIKSGGKIFTKYQIIPEHIFKGLKTDTVSLVTEGGRVGLEMMVITHPLHLNIGDKGVFFLNKTTNSVFLAKSYYEPYAHIQGVYLLNDDKLNSYFKGFPKEFFYKYLESKGMDPIKELGKIDLPSSGFRIEAPSISNFSPTKIAAGVEQVFTINGAGFGGTQGTVLFTNADDGGKTISIQPVAGHFISWSDNQIRLKVPSDAGTGKIIVKTSGSLEVTSADTLTVLFTINNAENVGVFYIPDLGDKNGEGGYTLKYAANFISNVNAVTTFEKVIQDWRCSAFVNYKIDGTSLKTTVNRDDVNLILFDNDDPLPNGVLGRASSYYIGCINGGGAIQWIQREFDIIFNSSTDFYYGNDNPAGNQYDFYSIAVHEVGHTMHIGHVINSYDVMHFSINNGQKKRILNTDDRAAADFMITKSTEPNLCGPNEHVKLTNGNCAFLPPPVTSTKFYSKSSGDLNDLASWGDVADGSGNAPSNFSSDNLEFNITNRTTASIAANWNITGVSSKIILGNGINAVEFAIPEAFNLSSKIDVKSNATLTISSSNVPEIIGIADNSTIVFSGGQNQQLNSSLNFYKVEVNKSAGKVKLNSGQFIVRKELMLTSGLLECSGNLTIDLSSASIQGSGNISGDVKFTRTISGKGYHYLGTPTIGATYSQIDDDIPIGTLPGIYNTYEYNEALLGDRTAQGWESVSTISKNLEQGKGTALYFSGNSMIDFIGAYNPNFTTTLPLTKSAATNEDGWHLISNPFASTINWDATNGWNKSNMGSTVYLYNPTTGLHSTYTTGVGGTNGGANFIAPLQGFWVQAGNGGGSLGIDNRICSTGNSSFFRTEANENILKLTIHQGSKSDEVIIAENENSTPEYDIHWDAIKMKNETGNINAYTTCNKNDLAVNSLPKWDTVNLKIELPNKRAFEIKCDGALGDEVIVLKKGKEIGRLGDGKLVSVNDIEANLIELQLVKNSNLIADGLPKKSYKPTPLVVYNGVARTLEVRDVKCILYSLDGKIAKEFTVSSAQSYALTGALKGVYILKYDSTERVGVLKIVLE